MTVQAEWEVERHDRDREPNLNDMYNTPLEELTDRQLLSMYYDSPMRDRMDLHMPIIGELAKRLSQLLTRHEARNYLAQGGHHK